MSGAPNASSPTCPRRRDRPHRRRAHRAPPRRAQGRQPESAGDLREPARRPHPLAALLRHLRRRRRARRLVPERQARPARLRRRLPHSRRSVREARHGQPLVRRRRRRGEADDARRRRRASRRGC